MEGIKTCCLFKKENLLYFLLFEMIKPTQNQKIYRSKVSGGENVGSSVKANKMHPWTKAAASNMARRTIHTSNWDDKVQLLFF